LCFCNGSFHQLNREIPCVNINARLTISGH
jgi:hypothetical protein